MSREMYNYKRTAITTARDLCYSDEVIVQIHNAKRKMKSHGLCVMQD